MRFLAITMAAVAVAFMIGYYVGAKPRACAYVQLSEGSGVVCSNDVTPWVGQ